MTLHVGYLHHNNLITETMYPESSLHRKTLNHLGKFILTSTSPDTFPLSAIKHRWVTSINSLGTASDLSWIDDHLWIPGPCRRSSRRGTPAAPCSPTDTLHRPPQIPPHRPLFIPTLANRLLLSFLPAHYCPPLSPPPP